MWVSKKEIEQLSDIVIMDINIPIMNGLKVIQASKVKYPDMAFVIVSGYDDFSYCREALRLKITDYILKPVNYDEFGSCIDHLKIALFENKKEVMEKVQGEQTIYGMVRYMMEHLGEEISLNVLASEFHLSTQNWFCSWSVNRNGISHCLELANRKKTNRSETR